MKTKKIINILLSLSFIFFIAVAMLPTASASILGEGATNQLKENTDLVGMSGGMGQASVGSIIATIIQAALGLLAAIFLALMIFAGFQWMTASGNETQVKKAQDTIKTAVIGLIIVLAAYAITYFVFKVLPFSGGTLGGVNGGGGGTP